MNYKKEGGKTVTLFKKTLLVMTCLLISLIPFNNAYANDSSYFQQVRQHYLKLIYDDKVIFHDKVNEGKIIQVKNTDGETLESEVLKQEMTLELEIPDIPKGYLLSYWDIQEDEKHFTITPKLVEAKEFKVTFNALDGGNLLNNNTLTKVITKSVDEGTALNDILPKVYPKKHHKFSGWYIKNKDGEFKNVAIENVKISNDLEYYAIFYPDVNDNNIDDRTEKITIKLIYNFENKVEEKTIHVGENIKLPKLERKDYIFMGWYYDENFEEKYNHRNPLIEDTTLYAKWEKAEKVIQESAEKPITDEDISNQIEKFLNERFRNLEGQALQNLTQTDENSPVSNDEQSIDENILNLNNEETEQKDNDSNIPNLTVSEIDSGVVTYTEPKYVFKNENIGEQFMIKFLDEENRFLFSITLPYGRIMHILDENGNIKKEYAVRQDTTITLNVDDYINEDSILLGFDSRTEKINNTYVTEIFPKTHYKTVHESGVASDNFEEEKSNKKIVTSVSLMTLSLGVIASAIYFVLKRRRKSDVLE